MPAAANPLYTGCAGAAAGWKWLWHPAWRCAARCACCGAAVCVVGTSLGPAARSSAASAWNPFSIAKSPAVLPLGSRNVVDAPRCSSALANST
eukprot:scaffold13167_cov123-Isochrysis_galbana.AAC.7